MSRAARADAHARAHVFTRWRTRPRVSASASTHAYAHLQIQMQDLQDGAVHKRMELHCASTVVCGHRRLVNLASVFARVHMHACQRARFYAGARASVQIPVPARARLHMQRGTRPNGTNICNVFASSFGIAAPRPRAHRTQPKLVRPKLIFGATEIDFFEKK